MAAPEPLTSYDEVPYESHSYAQCHPSRLFTIATLFGLRPSPLDRCRVLELGSASGGNVVPMAEAFPGSEFVGIDFSARQISDGQRLLDEASLKNVQLRHSSITEVDESYGKFDYILCHGVFSWVAPAVQEKILQICERQLTPNGVAYVSYNTYPGWYLRGATRDLMRYHSSRFASPKERTRQARAFLDFMAESVSQDGSPYSLLLRRELDVLRHHGDHYVYHEHLEEVNDPLYFHEFVERAEAHGLRYLGEARLPMMVPSNFAPDVAKALKVLATDQIQTEQYMDFLRNRMFRETLLVPARSNPTWVIRPERLHDLHIGCGSRVDEDAKSTNAADAVKFVTPSGAAISTASPLIKAALNILIEEWPRTLPFHDLLQRVAAVVPVPEKSNAAEFAGALATGLVHIYSSSDLIELQGHAIECVKEAGEKPRAMSYARVRARHGLSVANLRHEVMRLTDLERQLLPLLDGNHSRSELIEALSRKGAAGELRIERNRRALTEAAEIAAVLEAVLPQALKSLAMQALLVR